MKKRIKDISIGLILGILLTYTTPISADSIIQKIDVALNSVNININDTILAKQNENYTLENGQQVPFSIVYKGTTYLPLRKIAESIGKKIEWDNTTFTASINDEIEMSDNMDNKLDFSSQVNFDISKYNLFKNEFDINIEYNKNKSTTKNDEIIFMIKSKQEITNDQEIIELFSKYDNYILYLKQLTCELYNSNLSVIRNELNKNTVCTLYVVSGDISKINIDDTNTYKNYIKILANCTILNNEVLFVHFSSEKLDQEN